MVPAAVLQVQRNSRRRTSTRTQRTVWSALLGCLHRTAIGEQSRIEAAWTVLVRSRARLHASRLDVAAGGQELPAPQLIPRLLEHCVGRDAPWFASTAPSNDAFPAAWSVWPIRR